MSRIESIKSMYPAGCRVRLVAMNDPWANLKPGSKGTVSFVDDTGTVHVKWDNGSGLGLIPGEDQFQRIREWGRKSD